MGDSSDKNDKTQLLSESQVLEVKPSSPRLPAEDKHDRSVWKGLVVGADEFAPPAPARSSSRRGLVIGILAVTAIGAGAYVLWPAGRAPAVRSDAAAAAVVAPAHDALPQPAPDAAPDAAPDVAPDAAVPEDAARAASADAGVQLIKRKRPPRRLRRKAR
ncbi:MAG: hypothetical protein ABI467_30285 [Kofleriaceae bacterium]